MGKLWDPKRSPAEGWVDDPTQPQVPIKSEEAKLRNLTHPSESPDEKERASRPMITAAEVRLARMETTVKAAESVVMDKVKAMDRKLTLLPEALEADEEDQIDIHDRFMAKTGRYTSHL